MTPNAPTRVLVVERVDHCQTLGKRLRAMGYTVAGAASTAEEALRLALENQPDVVLMDINLGGGGMDGVEAAAAIRRQTEAPVVFLTAHSDPATLERAKVTGPHGYVLKPYHDRDIHTTIGIRICRHRSER